MQNTLILALVAATLIIPISAAQESDEYRPSLESMMSEVDDLGDLVVSVESKRIDFSWTGIRIGPNMSAWVRHTFDETFGDGNGTVEVDEMEAGEELLKAFVKQQLDAAIHDVSASGHFLIDTKNAQSVAVTSLETQGLVGQVNSSQPIDLSFSAIFSFPTQSQDVHTITLDMGRYYFRAANESQAAGLAGDFTLTVAGASGWSIDGDSVQPDCVADNFDASTDSIILDGSDVNCFTGHSGLLIGFAIGGGDDGNPLGMPGFEMPLLVLALVGGAALARRRP